MYDYSMCVRLFLYTCIFSVLYFVCLVPVCILLMCFFKRIKMNKKIKIKLVLNKEHFASQTVTALSGHECVWACFLCSRFSCISCSTFIYLFIFIRLKKHISKIHTGTRHIQNIKLKIYMYTGIVAHTYYNHT